MNNLVKFLTKVFVFPPKESWRSLVSFESRYGTCFVFPSTKAEITFPKAESDKLIFVASFILSPVAPVLLALSLPAKSTKFNFPFLIMPLLDSHCSLGAFEICSTLIMKILWDRELPAANDNQKSMTLSRI